MAIGSPHTAVEKAMHTGKPGNVTIPDTTQKESVFQQLYQTVIRQDATLNEQIVSLMDLIERLGIAFVPPEDPTAGIDVEPTGGIPRLEDILQTHENKLSRLVNIVMALSRLA